MINAHHDSLSVRSQCKLLSLNRSTLYYTPTPFEEDTALANEIHTIWLEMPFYGYRRIVAELKRRDHNVNGKRVLRLMREMNIEALYPRPRTSMRASGHKIYPYLLKGLMIDRPNQVWATDITYLKMSFGFAYLVALIDVFSRFIVAWRVSNTMDTSFCLEMLEEGLIIAIPEIINTDQGSQFTSEIWVKAVEGSGVRVSMDGKGRWVDNITIERFWRTLKHEHFLLHSYDNLVQARGSIADFIKLYNYRRLHQSLGYQTPAEVYGKALKEVRKTTICPPDGYVDNSHSELPTCPQAQQQQQTFINIRI